MSRFVYWWTYMNGGRSEMLGMMAFYSSFFGVFLVAGALLSAEWKWVLRFSMLFVVSASCFFADVATDIVVMRNFHRKMRHMDAGK